MPEHTLGALLKFNPSFWSPQDIRSAFTVRLRELEQVVEAIRKEGPGQVPQHWLISGQHGMGKSMLLRRIGVAVEDDPGLRSRWVVLAFPESLPVIGSLADVWTLALGLLGEALRLQGEDPGRIADLDRAMAVLRDLPTEQARAREALALLVREAIRGGRRLLLLVDRLDILMETLRKAPPADTRAKGRRGPEAGQPLWALREVLSREPQIMFIGTSRIPLEAIQDYSEAFHDFLATVELWPLEGEDFLRMLPAMARQFGPGPMALGSWRQDRTASLKALWSLSDGDPRTAVVLFQILCGSGREDLPGLLVRLLDERTPDYRARMDRLSLQQRQVLAHLMEAWAPQTVASLASRCHLAKGTLSAQLSRLEAEHLVRKVELPGSRRMAYQVRERLFNLWHLLGQGPRETRRRLDGMLAFLGQWQEAFPGPEDRDAEVPEDPPDGQPLASRLEAAVGGDREAFRRLIGEVMATGHARLGLALAARLEGSPFAFFAEPLTLALRAAAGDPVPMGSAPQEIRELGEAVLGLLRRDPPHREGAAGSRLLA